MRETETVILTESVVEDATLDWFRKLGYELSADRTCRRGSERCGLVHAAWRQLQTYRAELLSTASCGS